MGSFFPLLLSGGLLHEEGEENWGSDGSRDVMILHIFVSLKKKKKKEARGIGLNMGNTHLLIV